MYAFCFEIHVVSAQKQVWFFHTQWLCLIFFMWKTSQLPSGCTLDFLHFAKLENQNAVMYFFSVEMYSSRMRSKSSRTGRFCLKYKIVSITFHKQMCS